MCVLTDCICCKLQKGRIEEINGILYIYVVKVINNAKEKLKLGKRFPLTNFNLIYDGEKQSGIILSGSGCDNNSVKQRSIKSYFSRMIGKNKKRKKSTTYKQQEEV